MSAHLKLPFNAISSTFRNISKATLRVFLCFNRYEYLRREGNFERSAGLQIGVDTIEVRAKQHTDGRQQNVNWQEKDTH